MTTAWKSGEKKSTNEPSTRHTSSSKNNSGTMLSFWSRQEILAAVTASAMLGLLVVAAACSKESAKPALVGVSSDVSPSTMSAPAVAPATTPAAAPVSKKKTAKKRPANVTYHDANSGVSFLYPRKFVVASGDKVQPGVDAAASVPMNFVQPGGVTVATVSVPDGSYPGTDFASAFFTVNVNRSVSEEECAHFGFVDTRNADGEPIDAEKVKVGSTDMEMTSDFTATAIKQAETEYYHSYENGACYEYVLGLGTEGYGTEGNIKHVDRDKVFAKLGKILGTVKIKPVEPEHAAEQPAAGIGAGKE